jgi:hypothetical protein
LIVGVPRPEPPPEPPELLIPPPPQVLSIETTPSRKVTSRVFLKVRGTIEPPRHYRHRISGIRQIAVLETALRKKIASLPKKEREVPTHLTRGTAACAWLGEVR